MCFCVHGVGETTSASAAAVPRSGCLMLLRGGKGQRDKGTGQVKGEKTDHMAASGVSGSIDVHVVATGGLETT